MENLKNMLGLIKKFKDNIYKDVIMKIKLNTYYNDTLKIAQLFTKAGFKVELYYKKTE